MYERKDREEREAREALANIKIILAERDTLIRQRAADLDALNAVQALHAQAVAERDAAVASAETSDAAARALGDDFTRVLRECRELKAERDEARAWIKDYKADHRAVVDGQCAGDERHCSCVPHLRRALDEARRQVEAMREVVEAARRLDGPAVYRALDRLDALAVPSTNGGG
jgi:hypothetical protein